MPLKITFIIVLFFLTELIYCQTIPLTNSGINVGLSFSLGTVVNRIGIYAGGYYYYDFIQVNTSIRGYYSFTTYGPSVRGFELQPSIGIIGSFGEKLARDNPFYALFSNQTRRKYAFGYGYNAYLDQAHTSQTSGTVFFGIDKIDIICENDILASKKNDKFRTAAGKVNFLYENMLFSVSTILWTGNPQSPQAKRINDSSFPARFGYVEFSEAPYGKYSHGILALQCKYAFDYGQELQLSAGIDSERVRNVVQNKVFHDMYFWPKRWNKAKNPHLPMLDEKGNPYLYQAGQKIRPAKFFIELAGNPGLFY